MSDTHAAITVLPERPGEPERMHPLVRAAMSGGQLDPAMLRDLLAVQREWEAGEARRAYTRSIVALKRDLPAVIARDRTVDYQGAKGRVHYTHASLGAALDAITGPLTAHGFSLSWQPATDQRGITVTCRLTHSEGHYEETTITAPADVSGGKNPAQAIASTITLLSRYTAMALLGLATADMVEPDGREPALATGVDSAANLRACGWLAKRGITRGQAVAFVGREVHQWTSADLDKLREWGRRPAVESPPDAPYDPGCDG